MCVCTLSGKALAAVFQSYTLQSPPLEIYEHSAHLPLINPELAYIRLRCLGS